MFQSILYMILGILGLGLLIFLHELAHYFVAKKVGMRIETFSIGLGKAIYSWNRNGVKWQLGILPFGGYVKIAGTEKENGKEPHEIKDGFFGKKPSARILVALAGPFVNLLLAFLLFAIIWISGGRDKPFSQYTKRIGYIDTNSKLYKNNVRPGDEVLEYGGYPFRGVNDLLTRGVFKDKTTSIKGLKIDYFANVNKPFFYDLQNYKYERTFDKEISTIGILSPAQFLIYRNLLKIDLMKNSPMKNSGIENNDRLIWVDGDLVFSQGQLHSIINNNTAFLTVKRNGKYFHTKIQKVKLSDLKIDPLDKYEFEDLKYYSDIKKEINELLVIPYFFSDKKIVEAEIPFIEGTNIDKINSRSYYYTPLQKNDKIVAVDGKRVQNAKELLSHLQERNVLIIVKRENDEKLMDWKNVDKNFKNLFEIDDLKKIVASIGRKLTVNKSSHLRLLNPVVPKPASEIIFPNTNTSLSEELADYKKEIEKIKDVTKRNEVINQLKKSESQRFLAIALVDKLVKYNPNPIMLFSDALVDTYRTFYNLVFGNISPKWMSGARRYCANNAI